MAATPSGKDKILRHSRIWIGGYDLSGDARTVGAFMNEQDEVPTWGISDTVYNYVASSARRVGVDGLRVIINETAGRAWDQLKGSNITSRFTFGFGGGGVPAEGDPAYLLPSVQLADNAVFDTQLGMMDVSFKYDSLQYDANSLNPNGVILYGDGAAISSTTNGTSHDNAASSANGWHANLHILATAAGNFAITIEHGTDDAAWATLGTFTADASAITSEHLSGTGTVNRYVRAVFTRTAGTITAVMSFARN